MTASQWLIRGAIVDGVPADIKISDGIVTAIGSAGPRRGRPHRPARPG
jgi:hypothetical protein